LFLSPLHTWYRITDGTIVGACEADDKRADVDVSEQRVGGLGESPRPEYCITEPRWTDFEGVVERSDNWADVCGRRVGVCWVSPMPEDDLLAFLGDLRWPATTNVFK